MSTEQQPIELGLFFSPYILKDGIGEGYTAETGFLIARDPDTVLAPDFAFIRASRLQVPTAKGYIPCVPDFVLEVLSPNDPVAEVEDKIQQWLDAGTQQVWIANINRSTITIHQKDSHPQVFSSTDTITAEDFFPGFSAEVGNLFPPRRA